LKTDADALASSSTSPIAKGLVADGVTPLLIKFTENEATADSTTYQITLSEPTGGSVASGLGSHLRLLQEDGFVAADAGGSGTLTIPAHDASTAVAFAYVSAI